MLKNNVEPAVGCESFESCDDVSVVKLAIHVECFRGYPGRENSHINELDIILARSYRTSLVYL
jgi:hypothetical protein